MQQQETTQQIIIESIGDSGSQADVITIEGFTLKTDIILKSILVGMWFYIINNPVISHFLSRNFRTIIDINLLQAIIFAIGFYVLFQFI